MALDYNLVVMRGPEHDPALPGERAPVLLLQAGRHVRHVGVHRRARALASFPQPYAPDEKTVSGFLSEAHHVTWHLQRAPWWPEQTHAPEMMPTTNHMKILRMNTSIFGRLLASFLHSSLSKTS